MANSRFKIPGWVSPHDYAQGYYELENLEELAFLRKKLLRFQVEKPLVSIVIPVWNEAKNIVRLLSAFADMEIPYPTELIIVNNQSTDDTVEILQRLGVTVVHEPQQGVARARLAGLKASRGKYQLCGDGDSLYPPTWIASMVDPLINNISISCVYGKYSFIPEERLSRFSLACYELLAESLFEYRRIKREYLNVRGANFGFRTDQGLAVGGFDPHDGRANSPRFSEDTHMARKLHEIGKLKLIRTSQARIWTSARRLLRDGTLVQALAKRMREETKRLFENVFRASKIKITTSQFQPEIK